MGYIESNLLKGEEIVAKAKIHWAVFIPAIVFLIIALLIFSKGDYEIFVILFGVFILALLKGLIVFKTNELAITNQRIIGKAGFVSRDTVELKYENREPICGARCPWANFRLRYRSGTRYRRNGG